jgi:ectoine hydroxylase-related dioxygenase (phytanoyl-CoA dioxygenase family)
VDAFFAEHGWMVVRGAVSAESVAALTAEFDRVFPPSAYPRADGPVLESIGASRAFPALARHVTDPAIAAHVARALGCRRVQLLQDTLMLKPPRHGGRVEWHQDHTYTGYLEPAAMVSVRLALTDCNPENGGMNVLDGSHGWGLVGATRILSAASVTDGLPPEWSERAREATRPIELAPGDLSLHHCLTFHGSLENRSPRPRKTVIARLFDAECRLVPSRLPSGAAAYFPTDGEGHLAAPAFPVCYGKE